MDISGTTIPVIDADSHLTEPPDLWTSRLADKWHDTAPRLVNDENGLLRWAMGGRLLHTPMFFGIGSSVQPTNWEEIDPACFDAVERARWMDAHGIAAQVVYPNLVAFESYAVMALEPELQRLVFRAYNDHQADMAAAAPGRFVLVAAVPFWDIDAAVEEMTRCAGLGFRGVLWAATMDRHGLPGVTDSYWDRFFAAAQDLDLSINFHVATGRTEEDWGGAGVRKGKDPATYVKVTSVSFLANANTIADVVTSGVCERFPRVSFVSVESGFGYLPFLLDALDWQWVTAGAREAYPDRMMPSDYFRRQVYTMFWFEQRTLSLVEQFPDNVLFETDFPHPTGLSPAPYTHGIPQPEVVIRDHVLPLGDELARKVLYENAARLYRLA